jgi:hypothetical protein
MVIILGLRPESVASNIILVGGRSSPWKFQIIAWQKGCFEGILEHIIVTLNKGLVGDVVDVLLGRAKRMQWKVAHICIMRLIDHLKHAITADAQGGTRLGKHSGSASIEVITVVARDIPAKIGIRSAALITSYQSYIGWGKSR